MAKKMKNKAQMTIFIIIGVVIVAGVILFFVLFSSNKPKSGEVTSQEPEGFIEQCTRNAVLEAQDIMLAQGGYIAPGNSILYQNNKVAYLCYNRNYYGTCINQEPLYMQKLESEIKNYISQNVSNCFSILKSRLEKDGYSVDAGDMILNVHLVPRQVNVDITKKFNLARNQETKNFATFPVKVVSPLYELGDIARELVNQEAKYCYAEYTGISVLYPKFSINKKNVGQEMTASKIYTIEEKASGKILNIAIRSCAIPAGL